VGMLCLLIIIQGCQKAASVPPKPHSSRQTVSAGKIETPKPGKPKPASTGTAESPKPGKPTAGKPPTPPKPPQKQGLAPKPSPLPSADINTNDAKYADGQMPKLEANGKPVTVLYLPPHMFSIELTRNGKLEAYFTFLTMTATGENGNRLEVHLTVRGSGPEGKFEPIGLIKSDATKKGQTWAGTAAGMSFKVEALDYGEWTDSPFPGSGMGWLKLRITAK